MKLTICSLFLCASLAAAQATPAKSAATSASATPAVQQASLAEVNQLLTLLKSREQMETMIGGLKQQMKLGQVQGFREALKQKGVTLSPADFGRAKTHLDGIVDAALKEVPYDEMLAATAEIYRKHFTSQDIAGLIAFYSSPAGKKFLQEMPSLTQESMQAGGEIMRKRMPEIVASAQKKMDDLVDEFTKNPPVKQ
jgi:uncharacterized protein